MDAFMGEIRLFPYTFVPEGWLACDGSIYPIQQYQALYAVIGPQFGGNGTSTFGVPDLRARVMVGTGLDPLDAFDPAYATSGGAESESLTITTVPPHTHNLYAAAAPQKSRVTTPAGNYIGALSTDTGPPFVNTQAFTSGSVVTSATAVALNAATLSPFAGGSVAHENRQPYLALQFCICWNGYFPSRQ